MRHISCSGLRTLAVALFTIVAMPVAQAQYDDERPPSQGYGREQPLPDARPVYREHRNRPAPRRDVGLNCDAVQQGLAGPQPYSCPLPGPRPLGTRCFCDMPIASFSRLQTAVGQVVP